VRAIASASGRPRLVKRRIGQPRLRAMPASREPGFRAVAVEVGPREIEALALGENLRVVQLAFLPAGGLHHLTGEHAVLDLEPGAHHVRNLESARERLDLISQRGGHDPERVPLRAVRLHQRARLRVDVLREALLEHLLRLLAHHLFAEAAVGRDHAREHAREADASERERHRARERVAQLLRRDAPRHHALAQERGRREAGDQRLIEIEQRTDLGAGGPLTDLAGQVVMEGHVGVSSARAGIMHERCALRGTRRTLHSSAAGEQLPRLCSSVGHRIG
jgi:hypothetical protein